jgi:uncharacterized membrane protein YbhN (UPF0104 family)
MAIKSRWILLLKVALFALVLWGLWHAVQDAVAELRDEELQRDFQWRELRWHWLCVAAGFYLAAQFVLALYWRRLLIAMQQAPGVYETVRAFFIGHLGKYLPGKMFTIMLRTGLVHSERVRAIPAGISVFVETLLYMSVGACLAALMLVVRREGPWQLRLAACGFAACVVIGTWPPLIKQIVARIQAVGAAGSQAEMPLIEVSTWIGSWAYCCAAWSLNALSLWATLCAIPIARDPLLNWDLFTRLLASVTMAVVAGFASCLPGAGLGVREWVLDQLLAVEFGPAVAILSAVMLRAIWLLTEIIGSAILYLVKPASKTAV